MRALGLAVIPRNHVLTFRTREPGAPVQDRFERLKIQNVRDSDNPELTHAAMGGVHDS